MFKGKICISRIDKIGDMILTLPVIKSVKIQNPGLGRVHRIPGSIWLKLWIWQQFKDGKINYANFYMMTTKVVKWYTFLYCFNYSSKKHFETLKLKTLYKLFFLISSIKR